MTPSTPTSPTSAPEAASAAAPAAHATPPGSPPQRQVDLRLAALHLRTGSFALARAELETMAGSGTLDDDGLLDLAEVRWRTGDLPGAGEAAAAFLTSGRESVLALVIAAEATARLVTVEAATGEAAPVVQPSREPGGSG